jgi:transcriptional regulator with XRE-family HTH domain
MRASTSEMLQSILDTGMSRERLAEALGVTPEDVDRLIQGESPSNDVAITSSDIYMAVLTLTCSEESMFSIAAMSPVFTGEAALEWLDGQSHEGERSRLDTIRHLPTSVLAQACAARLQLDIVGL